MKRSLTIEPREPSEGEIHRNLGIQYVLVSEKAFAQLTFTGAEAVSCETYFPKYTARDSDARAAYKEEIRRAVISKRFL